MATAAADGFRVLALAYRESDGAPDLDTADRDLVLAPLVGLRDPARPEAAQAVDEAERAGVRVVMATGDHPGTASAIAREVGLDDADLPPLTGADLERDGLPADAAARPVYARVDPTRSCGWWRRSSGAFTWWR